MKRKYCYLTIIVSLFCAQQTLAQIPEFVRMDTGAIYDSEGFKLASTHLLFDIDNDGDSDPIICKNSAMNIVLPLALYENERKGYYHHAQFIKDSEDVFSVNLQSALGDIDNDGDIDVIGQSYGTRDLGIFINDGYGNFELDSILPRPELTSSYFITIFPLVLDFNKDGFLDLISFDSVIMAFYNNGAGRFFETEIIGSINRSVRNDWLHAMAIGDADNDGDMDIYCGLSRGVEKNAFFINMGDAFEQVDDNHIILSDTALTTSVSWVDYDNDGDMDLFTTNESPGAEGVLPILFENQGNLEFTKQEVLEEKYRGSFTISDHWGDLDNDADQDLFITLEQGPFPFSGPYRGTYSSTPYNILYENKGDGVFVIDTINNLAGGEAHTASIFDHDNDGDLDVLTVGNAYKNNGHNYLYTNAGNANSFISILFTDKYSCATPYGTRIVAKSELDGKSISQTKELSQFDGNASCKYSPTHFGLGSALVVDSLIIRWPSGHIDTILDIPANQYYHAMEDSVLEVDLKASNYIQLYPAFSEVEFSEAEISTSIDLDEYYSVVINDKSLMVEGDILEYELLTNANSKVANAKLEGTVLSIIAGTEVGGETIRVVASNSFAKRMDNIEIINNPTSNFSIQEFIYKVYPNPTSGRIVFSDVILESYNQVSLYNVLGEKVLTTSQIANGIDLEQLPSGLYFIQFSKNSNSSTLVKLIKH